MLQNCIVSESVSMHSVTEVMDGLAYLVLHAYEAICGSRSQATPVVLRLFLYAHRHLPVCLTCPASGDSSRDSNGCSVVPIIYSRFTFPPSPPHPPSPPNK